MKILIKITKEVYERAMWCSFKDECFLPTQSCAVALSIRDLDDLAHVSYRNIIWSEGGNSPLPEDVIELIQLFDSTPPANRPNLPPFSFEVEFPDELIEKIGIEEATRILTESETLEMVTR